MWEFFLLYARAVEVALTYANAHGMTWSDVSRYYYRRWKSSPDAAE